MKFVFRSLCVACAMLFAAAIPAKAADVIPVDSFLDLMQGRWNVTGTYNGHPADHAFKAEWVFRNGYLRFRDVSEEEKANGLEEFEVIAYIGFDAAKSRYVCIWIDNSGTPEPETVAAATPRVGDSLPFVFKKADGNFRSTMTYDAKANIWTWTMETEKNGVVTPLANLKLSRKK